MQFLSIIQFVGGAVYDIFYLLGLYATTPLIDFHLLDNLTYINPINNITVSILYNEGFNNAIVKIGEFFQNNLIFSYENFNMSDLNFIGLFVLGLITVFFIRIAIGIVGLFIPK